MKIYLDTCCYCRPIRDAVRLCRTAGFIIVGSSAIKAEMADIKNDGKRERAQGFYDETVNDELSMDADIINRAQELSVLGMKPPDSYHIAFAESAGVNFMLTTDKRLERSAERLGVKVKVINPISFIEEYIKWLRSSM